MEFLRELYDLELVLDSRANIYEINYWVSEGSKINIAFWEKKEHTMHLVFVENLPFAKEIDEQLFWQLAEQGQEVLDSYFCKEEIADA